MYHSLVETKTEHQLRSCRHPRRVLQKKCLIFGGKFKFQMAFQLPLVLRWSISSMFFYYIVVRWANTAISTYKALTSTCRYRILTRTRVRHRTRQKIVVSVLYRSPLWVNFQISFVVIGKEVVEVPKNEISVLSSS